MANPLRALLLLSIMVWTSGALPGIAAGNACPARVPPLVTLAGVSSFYKKDASQSVVDQDLMDDFVSRTWQYGALLDALLDIGKRAKSGKANAASECALNQLSAWAEAGALTQGIAAEAGVERRQAIMIQAWTVVGVTTLLQELAPSIDSQDPRSVATLRWLKSLAQSVRAEFVAQPNRPAWLNHSSNHSLWAGLAEARVGQLTGNQQLINDGLSKLDRALDGVAADGSMPAEMSRAGRALQYTNFAMLPLAGLVKVHEQQALQFTKSRADAIERLVLFTMSANIDVDVLVQKTGKRQEVKPLGNRIIWLAVLLPALERGWPDIAEPARALLERVKPIPTPFYGVL